MVFCQSLLLIYAYKDTMQYPNAWEGVRECVVVCLQRPAHDGLVEFLSFMTPLSSLLYLFCSCLRFIFPRVLIELYSTSYAKWDSKLKALSVAWQWLLLVVWCSVKYILRHYPSCLLPLALTQLTLTVALYPIRYHQMAEGGINID